MAQQVGRASKAACDTIPQRVVPGNYWYGYGVCTSCCTSLASDSFSNTLFDAQFIDAGLSNARQSIPQSCTPAGKRHGMPSKVQKLIVAALVSAACFVALCMVLAIAGPMVSPAIAEGSLSETAVISVEPGESLWSIAEKHPIRGMTTQQCVRWIMERNDLSDSVLMVGQVLSVPTGN